MTTLVRPQLLTGSAHGTSRKAVERMAARIARTYYGHECVVITLRDERSVTRAGMDGAMEYPFRFRAEFTAGDCHATQPTCSICGQVNA